MRVAVILFLLLLPLGGAVYLGIHVWRSMAGVDVGLHGAIAMAVAVVFSLLLAGGLMSLVFFSARHGHDEKIGDSQVGDSINPTKRDDL